ncbi:polymerase [Vibrio phage J14]|nr:polymerase [Vibrio phage J14]
MSQPMKKAYREGMDLHALTGGEVANVSYEDMLVLAKEDPKPTQIRSVMVVSPQTSVFYMV